MKHLLTQNRNNDRTNDRVHTRGRNRVASRGLALLLLLALALSLALPAAVAAAGRSSSAQARTGKIVRVGWFDSSFCYFDSFGRRCGIDYEYQHRIAAYTGWTYEYVEDSWPNLFRMLRNGEIDLLSDVSYTEERTATVSYPDLPMGTETYYIYIAADDREHIAEDLSTFNGARIGVNRDSVQEGFLRDWAERNGVTLEIVPVDTQEDASMALVASGELDGYASIYTFGYERLAVPVCRIGASEFYYGVSKDRPDLLAELNVALAGIQADDPSFSQQISEERLLNSRTSAFLTPTQEDWIAEHGTVRVGYRDNYLPFCQADPATGALTGALKDYLVHAANNLGNAAVRFEAIPYETTEAALAAMEAGEVDCVFPVYLSSYDAEQRGVRLTSPAMNTEVNTIMRASDVQGLSSDSTDTIAVRAGDPNVVTFLMDRYPAASMKACPTTEDCLAAVAAGEADCALMSNYRVPSVEEALTKHRLFSVPSGEAMAFSFAVDEADRELYFLLNKTVLLTRSEDMDSALASYMRSEQKVSLGRFLRDNWLGVVLFISVLFLLIVLLLLMRLWAVRRANAQQRMMEEALRRELEQKEKLQAAMKMAYTDPLTGVKSKHAWKEAGERMDRRIGEEEVSAFGVVVFDLNDLKQINDSRGHEAGDELIREACRLICVSFRHSPVYRIGGDEFTAILEGEDYANREELLSLFEKKVLANLERGRAVVAFGCGVYYPGRDRSIRVVFDRADAEMYKKKDMLKSLGEPKHARAAERGPMQEELPVINLRKSVLIVDDEDISREMLGNMLREDYDVLLAADGVEALELLQTHRDGIAIVLLDLYMPNMTGRELMARMQADEELMYVPVIFLSVDEEAELDCLQIGAMDFIPKPYPSSEIIKARIARCVELSENRDLIRRTQRDRLTGLFNYDYFLRYVNRYDVQYRETAFDAVVCEIEQVRARSEGRGIQFGALNERFGLQFGALVLRSVGIGLQKLSRSLGGIGCRQEGDAFLFYCPHQEDHEALWREFTAGLFVDAETASRVRLRFGVYENAQQEPDVEERFVRARAAADAVAGAPEKLCGYYEFAQGGIN